MSALQLTPADIRGIENRSAGIRTFLRSNGASTVKEICLGLGITDAYTRGAVRASLRSMTIDGILARDDAHNPGRYSVVREPEPRKATPPAHRRTETYRIKSATTYQKTEAEYLQWRERTAHLPPVSERIREAVKRIGEATAEQIYEALGISPTVGRTRIYASIHYQVRDKMLESIKGKPMRYRWLRDADPFNRPKRPPTAKAKARAEALQQRKFNHQQRLAERRAARDERIAQHKRETQERRETRQRDAFARAQLKAQRQQPHIAKLAAGASARAAAKPSQTAVAVEPESIDKWMARTGKTPEVLPHHFDDPITSYPRRRPIYNPKGHSA